jgi:hypothetical protein
MNWEDEEGRVKAEFTLESCHFLGGLSKATYNLS